MSKMFSTETYMMDAADLLALTSSTSVMHAGGAIEKIEDLYRQSIAQTIYGGTSEIHRSIIAEIGLGLPRARG